MGTVQRPDRNKGRVASCATRPFYEICSDCFAGLGTFVDHRFGRCPASERAARRRLTCLEDEGAVRKEKTLVFVVKECEIVIVLFHRAAVFEGTAGLPLHDDAGKNRDRKTDEDKKADALEGFEEEVVKRCEIHGVSFREGCRAYAA